MSETEEIRLPTLEEFMAMDRWPLNAFVTEPGFEELYVRKSVRIFNGMPHKALDIARVKVERPGKGVFTRFSERMLSMGRNLYVESVQNPRFERKLLELGFLPHETNPCCYYKLGRATKGVTLLFSKEDALLIQLLVWRAQPHPRAIELANRIATQIEEQGDA